MTDEQIDAMVEELYEAMGNHPDSSTWQQRMRDIVRSHLPVPQPAA